MNVKKVLLIALAVCLLCAVCCGAASAMNVKEETMEISDPGSLVPGETITAKVKVDIPKGTYTNSSSSKLELSTDLDAASWSLKFMNGSELLTPYEDTGKTITIGWFTLLWEYETTTIDITVKGVVGSESAGSTLVAMKIDSYEVGGKYPSWSTPEQRVYSTAGLNTELSKLNTEITAFESRINMYTGYGWDVSEAQGLLNNAKTQYNDARSASSANIKTAYLKIEDAYKSLKNAEMKLALSSLSMTLSYTTYTQDIIDMLYAKGWNSEAMLLDTKNSNLKNIYNQQYALYKAGNLPDAATIDKLAADSYLLYQDALVYKESADHPFAKIMDFLPFILIGLGALAIIVVVIVVIVKKRKNSWDELG